MKRYLILALMAAMAGGWLPQAGAQEAVLYTGSDWCAAGEGLQAVWKEADFAAEAGVRLRQLDVLEQGESPFNSKDPASQVNIDRFPALALFDAAGRCLLLQQGLPPLSGKAAKADLKQRIAEGLARGKQVEALLAKGTPEAAGQAIALLLPELGLRGTQAGYGLQAAWKTLQEKDPADATGWQFGLTFDAADAPAERVRALRESGDATAFERYYAELNAKPKTHLSVNQQQGLKMLRVAFYRAESSKRKETQALLREILSMDAQTHFGLAAQGLLCMAGEGPLSIPYGWFARHARAGEQRWEIPVGGPRRSGWYELTLKRTGGSGEMQVRVGKAWQTLGVGERLALPAFEVKPEAVGKPLTCQVRFRTPKGERGELTLREVLPPRPARLKRGTWVPGATTPLISFLWRKVSADCVETLLQRPGGADFLCTFFADEGWMERFCASGEPLTSWPAALNALETLAAYFDLEDEELQLWATAAALNAAEDPTPMVLLFGEMVRLRAKKQLWTGMAALRCDQLRYLFLPEQCPAESVRELAARFCLPPRRYGEACWAVPYRPYNFFGDSIHGPDYYTPWRHAYVRHEESRRVGGVCGALSYYGSAAAKVHGVPSVPAGQPGHCAYVFWNTAGQPWHSGNAISPFSWPHFCLWGERPQFAYQELADAAFAASGHLTSMHRLWRAERLQAEAPGNPQAIFEAYQHAIQASPLNLTALRACNIWMKTLEDCPAEWWLAFAQAVAGGLKNHVKPAWDLLLDGPLPALKARLDRERFLALLGDCSALIRQGPQPTFEFCDYEEVLEAQAKLLEGDDEALFALFRRTLEAQYGTPDAFGKALRWGCARFLRRPDYAQRTVAAIEALLKDKGPQGSDMKAFLREAIGEASAAENTEAFNALCDLQEALAPTARAAERFEGVPASAKPLSERGLLRLSSTSPWDHPEAYRQVIDRDSATAFFHTAEETGPWAEVKLPGMAKLSAVYLLNRENNTGRLVPFALEISEDGQAWQTLATEKVDRQRYVFRLTGQKARYVRVRCTPPGGAKTFLHLRKFVVFGTPLY